MAKVELADPSFFDETPNEVPKEPRLADSSFFDENEAAPLPTHKNVVEHQQTKYALPQAIVAGGVKGIGELGRGLSRAELGLLNTLLPANKQLKSPQDPFDYSRDSGKVGNYLGDLEKRYPNTSKASQIAAQMAGTWELPMANIGKVLPKIGNFLTESQAGRLIAAPVNAGISGTAYAPIYNPDKNAKEAAVEGGITGTVLGLVAPSLIAATKMVGKGGKRLWEVINTNAAKAQEKEGKAIEEVHEAAKQAGINISPQKYQSVLRDAIEEIGSHPTGSVHEDVSKDLESMQKALQKDLKDRPESFSVKGTKGLITGIGEKIEKAQKSKDKTAAKIYTMAAQALREDIVDNLISKGQSKLAEKLTKANENYSKTVIPFRENATTLPGVIGHAAALGITPHLTIPHGVASMLASKAGLHGVETPLGNAYSRFVSGHNGGVKSILKDNVPRQETLNKINAALYPSLFGNYSS